MNMRNALRSEDTEQINVMEWAVWQTGRYPELKWLHHIPNGGSRNKAEAVKFKQLGVKSGVSDLCLPYPKGIYCGLYIEMKYGDGRHQESQKEFLCDMAAAGHYVATCYTASDAIDLLTEYCMLDAYSPCMADKLSEHDTKPNSMTLVEPNNSLWRDGSITPLKVGRGSS